MSKAQRNYIAYFLLLLCLCAVHFVIAAYPGATRSIAQSAVFSWASIAIFGAAGLFGVFCLNRTRLRGFWDPDLGLSAKLGLPLLLGLVLGVVDTAMDMRTGWTHVVAAKLHMTTIHIAWPLSLPIYFGGAIFVTIIYYLVLLPLLDWLVAERFLGGRGEAAVYWTAGFLLALVEPLTQDLGDVLAGDPRAYPGAIADLVLNLGQVAFFRGSGFISAIVFRIGYYAIWHVLYGLMG